jgi:hypothetical protein
MCFSLALSQVKKTELRRVLGELARAMTPNGVLFVSNPRSMEVIPLYFLFFWAFYIRCHVFGLLDSVLWYSFRKRYSLYAGGAPSFRAVAALLHLCCSVGSWFIRSFLFGLL